MRMQGNTIFITGGSSGIGRGLAEAFHREGNQVIVAGRREARLRELCAANAGMRYFVLDVRDPRAILAAAETITEEFPALNCVFNNAGVQTRHDFSAGQSLDERAVTDAIGTNLLGVVRVAAAFLPHLKRQAEGVLVNVSSGLAFVPLARFPVYCATKAAVHSFTLSLRLQLEGSRVQVIELVPPYVATELGGAGKPAANSDGPRPMPIDAFIAEAMRELAAGGAEAVIGDARHLVAAACSEKVREISEAMNRR